MRRKETNWKEEKIKTFELETKKWFFSMNGKWMISHKLYKKFGKKQVFMSDLPSKVWRIFHKYSYKLTNTISQTLLDKLYSKQIKVSSAAIECFIRRVNSWHVILVRLFLVFDRFFQISPNFYQATKKTIFIFHHNKSNVEHTLKIRE